MGRPALAAVTTIGSFLLFGTFMYHHMEDWTWIESLYFSASTITTVGYGDIAPTSDATRLFTVIYLFFGAAAVVSSLGIIGGRYLERRSQKLARRMENK